MDRNTIEQRVASFPRWHYEMDLRGVKTPIFDPGKMVRHHKRREHLFGPLLDLTGGSLEGKRVLDLGCNAGFWSLAAIEAGADFVLGIDGRQMHIDQASLVFEANDIAPERYEFTLGDVAQFDYSAYPPFDIVLFLGLLYHVANPLDIIHAIQRVNSDIMVIDTNISQDPGESFRLVIEDVEDPRNAIGHGMVLWPTVGAMHSIMAMYGYDGALLKPNFESCPMVQDYFDGDRRALICARESDLSAITAPREGQFEATRR